MNLKDVFPPDGHIQTLYCDSCKKHLDLIFTDFNETVSNVRINILGLPMLFCSDCQKSYMPEDTRFSIIYSHQQAIKKSINEINITRTNPKKNFNFGSIPFIYDTDDYYYIPGLARPWNEGSLTPVFFNKEVLLKYDASPVYRVVFASATYGSILKDDDFSISFGINKNGKVIMWLGDISTLPNEEQYYLRSENISSDHSIGCEFYDGQIERIYTELSKENNLFKQRSEFLEAFFKKFGKKIAHLDKEVFELASSLNRPLIDTDKERKHIADSLNKIYLESFDNKLLASVLQDLGEDPRDLGSIKRLQKIIEIAIPNIDSGIALAPFYILYDLRVACSHLGSEKGKSEKLNSVRDRLKIPHTSDFLEIYDALIKELTFSYQQLAAQIK